MTDDQTNTRMKPSRPKYGWTNSEQALHKIIRRLAEDIAKCSLISGGSLGTADEIERAIHEDIQQARHDQDAT